MIKIVCVGKIKEKYLNDGINEYIKRCSAYTKITIEEVKDEKTDQKNSDALNEQIKITEGKRILDKINDDEFVVVLDLHGKDFTSEQIASKLTEIQTYSSSKVTFVIGGSLGLSQDVVKRANLRWKLSSCTFPHQLCRLILVEQIYRMYKINSNEPYHK